MEFDRLQKRIAKNLLARMKDETGEFFAYIFDVSKGGLGFACNRKMDLGSQISAFLNVPERKSMTLVGKLTWKRELPSIAKNRFQYGLKLSERNEDYFEYVENLIRRNYERRVHPRFHAVLEIQNNDVMDLLDATTEDISAAGLYIRTSRPLKQGAQHEIALSGEGLEKPLLCIGEVVAVFMCEPDEFDHPYGAGVKIISFVGENGRRFEEYIKKLETLYEFHWPGNADST